jgi:hypothetical protein
VSLGPVEYIIIGQEDIDHAAESLEPNMSAALLIREDTWGIPLVEAMRNADGVLLEGSRIPHGWWSGVRRALVCWLRTPRVRADGTQRRRLRVTLSG